MWVAKRVPHRPGFPTGFWKKQTGASSEVTGAGGARVPSEGAEQRVTWLNPRRLYPAAPTQKS